jgi:hypothetical protein
MFPAAILSYSPCVELNMDKSRFVVSHPCARKTAHGWGAQHGYIFTPLAT